MTKPPYKIEKGVPLSRMGSLDWLEGLEVGDSFVMPEKDAMDNSLVQSIYNWGHKRQGSCYRFKSKLDHKSRTRRMWRIA